MDRRRRGLPHHGRPLPNTPPGHQAVDHVGVVPGELFDELRTVRAEQEHGPVDGLSERAGQLELAPAMRRPGAFQVFLAVGRTAPRSSGAAS